MGTGTSQSKEREDSGRIVSAADLAAVVGSRDERASTTVRRIAIRKVLADLRGEAIRGLCSGKTRACGVLLSDAKWLVRELGRRGFSSVHTTYCEASPYARQNVDVMVSWESPDEGTDAAWLRDLAMARREQCRRTVERVVTELRLASASGLRSP